MTSPPNHRTTSARGRRFDRITAQAQRLVTGLHTLLYRLSAGRIGGRLGNAPVLLLFTLGRRSGRLRITPLCYVQDGARIALIGSNGGAASDPAWVHNLRARPRALVQIGAQLRPVRARMAEGPEREHFWQQAVALYAGYATYQRRTDRRIPVIVLEAEQ
jgi:deazaflavin-dependent oxidoreductase (nitroreductase family)